MAEAGREIAALAPLLSCSSRGKARERLPAATEAVGLTSETTPCASITSELPRPAGGVLRANRHHGHHVGQEHPGRRRLRPARFTTTSAGAVGLLRDLADLHQLAAFTETSWELIERAGHGIGDRGLVAVASRCF
jgi:hypothetical protein